MYEFDTRIRFSEVDSEGKLTLIGLLNYFQDASIFHSEDCGVGTLYLKEHSLAWVLNAWQIDIKRYPVFNEKVTVGTFPTSFKSFIGNRNFIIKDENGDAIVMANSIWTFMDMEKMRPAKVEDDFIKVYTMEEPLPMDYSARKIMIPKEQDFKVTKKEALTVREYHLDSNMHVNNGQYVQIADAFLPGAIRYDRLRVEYRKQARLGDIIIPIIYERENTCIVALCDEKESPYAVIEACIHTV